MAKVREYFKMGFISNEIISGFILQNKIQNYILKVGCEVFPLFLSLRGCYFFVFQRPLHPFPSKIATEKDFRKDLLFKILNPGKYSRDKKNN